MLYLLSTFSGFVSTMTLPPHVSHLSLYFIEAIAASHMGIRVAAMSCITNMAAGISGNPLSEQEVLDNAAKASDNSCALVKEFVRRIEF